MRWALLLCLGAGCGGASFPSPPVAADAGYPAGPYGYAPAQTLFDLLFAGKIVPAGTPAASVASQMISLGSLRAEGARLFVIETVGEWCSDCVGDQPSMMQLEHDYAPRGVLGVQVILEAALDVAPTLDNLDRWSNAYDVSGVILLDANKSFEHAAAITAFPTYFVVDTSTMEIVERDVQPLVAAPLGPTLDAYLSR